jgi:hypothetical protein
MQNGYSDMEQLVRRIERVEKQNHRMRGLASVLGILLLAVVFMGAQSALYDGQFRNITAQGITIVDEMGKVKIEIGSSEEGAGLRVFNARGQRVVGLGIAADEGGSGMVVADKEGMPRFGLGMDEGVPSLAMADDAGKKVIGLGGSADGYGLVVMSGNEMERIGVGIDRKGTAGLVLYDHKGQYVRGMIHQQDGVHYQSHVDENGEEVVHR